MKGLLLVFLIFSPIIFYTQSGCTDPLANNYDALATENDGSCTYDPTTIIPELLVANMPNGINEQSGMIFFEEQFWIINDSGNMPEIYLWDQAIQEITDTIQFENFENTDWESLEQDNQYIYIGDFGNNAGNRTDLRILKLVKSELLGLNPEEIIPDAIEFFYPEQTDFSDQFMNHDFDCEAFIIWQNEIYLFTKEWISNQTSVYKIPNEIGNHEAELLGTLPVEGLVTGAGLDLANQLIVLLGYQINLAIEPFIYMLWDYPPDNFSMGNKRRLMMDWSNYQTETIAPIGENCWYIGSEYWEIGPLGFQNQLRKVNVSEFLSGSIGVTEMITAKQPIVFPNPSNGIIYYPDDFDLVRILRSDGTSIDVRQQNELRPGVYVMYFKKNGDLFQQKLVVVN